MKRSFEQNHLLDQIEFHSHELRLAKDRLARYEFEGPQRGVRLWEASKAGAQRDIANERAIIAGLKEKLAALRAAEAAAVRVR